MKKKWLALLLVFTLIFSMAACSGSEEEQLTDEEEQYAEEAEDSVDEKALAASEKATGYEDSGDSWAIYWYLCGSDLESEDGSATADLEEMMSVELPENINVIIETGGANEWQNDFVDSSVLQRYLYSSDGLELLEELPSASMGEADTLADFLSFADANYPADKVAVIFWNHGGGSVSGAAFDELYDHDSLDLSEMHSAFTSVWEASEEAQPLELVGFDTCLMATVDVAYTFSDLARYLVGSEETEPGNGWEYSGWLDALSDDPSMGGAELGKHICDTFYAGCAMEGTDDEITLSVTDLSKIGPLLEAYEAFGAEALSAACKDPSFFSQFGRAARKSENYGGNTKEQGYTNMVDLGDLAKKSSELLPSAQAVLDALEDCISYRINGTYRKHAMGLSCYYSYNADIDDLNGYAEVCTGDAFKYYYTYNLTGELDESGIDYISGMDLEYVPGALNYSCQQWDGVELDVDDEGTAFMTLGPEANDILTSIGFSLYRVDEDNDEMLLLGTDNDIDADWDNGVFYDNFRGVWGSIDGCLVYMELSFEGDDYNLYAVPVLLNGEEYNLQVVYDFNTEQWSILGARQDINETGMADKNVRLLKKGDELTTLWFIASYSGYDEFENYPQETIIVTEDTAFAEMALPDGSYLMMFEMQDAMGCFSYSGTVTFDCEDGEIITTVY